METQATLLPGLTARTDQQREIARSRLQGYLEKHLPRAQATLDRVLNEIPQDQLVPGAALTFSDTTGVTLNDRIVGDHALSQMAERAGLRAGYIRELNDRRDFWGPRLAAHTLQEHYQNVQDLRDARYLVRRVDQRVRGFLSDRFRRIDSRPIAAELVAQAKNIGAVCCDGTASEVKTSMKFIIPKVLEPYPGEYVVFGVAWSNSDYGAGRNDLSAFVVRLWCWNGMVSESVFRQIHLGGRLSDDIDHSDRTIRLDTATMVSASRDAIRSILTEGQATRMLEEIRRAQEQPFDANQAVKALQKDIGKQRTQEVVGHYNSANIVDLPAGASAWRWSNAISLVARDEQDGQVRIDLEKLAGAVLIG